MFISAPEVYIDIFPSYGSHLLVQSEAAVLRRSTKKEGYPMTAPNAGSLFRRLGTKPVINACGIYTDLGGSRLSPSVWAAMAEANETFVRLIDLLDSSGAHIAKLLG